jgi:hypothetical protein
MKFLVLMLLLTSCAMLKKETQDRFCNYHGAFEFGVNDALESQPMKAREYASACDEKTKPQALKGYEEGYLSTNPSYGRKQTQECIGNYGKKVCGYHCKEAYGDIKCATRPDYYCLADYGKIVCGKNCKTDFGLIKCDKEDL